MIRLNGIAECLVDVGVASEVAGGSGVELAEILCPRIHIAITADAVDRNLGEIVGHGAVKVEEERADALILRRAGCQRPVTHNV